MEKSVSYIGTCMSSGLAFFVEESLRDISVWLAVMLSVVIADLAAGIYKIVKRNGKLRVSKGMRDTMGKIAVYFSFVVAAVFAEKAAEIDLAKWACLLVISGEGVSIISNLLKAHGFDLDVTELLRAAGKKAGVDNAGNIIKEEKDENESID